MNDHISSHWPTMDGLKEAATFVLMIAGAVLVFWALAS